MPSGPTARPGAHGRGVWPATRLPPGDGTRCHGEAPTACRRDQRPGPALMAAAFGRHRGFRRAMAPAATAKRRRRAAGTNGPARRSWPWRSAGNAAPAGRWHPLPPRSAAGVPSGQRPGPALLGAAPAATAKRAAGRLSGPGSGERAGAARPDWRRRGSGPGDCGWGSGERGDGQHPLNGWCCRQPSIASTVRRADDCGGAGLLAGVLQRAGFLASKVQRYSRTPASHKPEEPGRSDFSGIAAVLLPNDAFCTTTSTLTK